MNMFDRFRTLLKKKTPTADELGQAVATARETYEAAKLKAGQESLLHPKHLLAGAAEAAKHKQLLAELESDLQDATVFLGALEERYAEVAAAEARAAKATRYEDARKLRDEAVARLEAEYDKHAIGLLTLLHLVAQADEAVAVANEDRPEDFPRLDTVEAIVRDAEDLPRKIIRERVISAWAYPDGNRPLSDELQARVSSTNGHTGHIVPKSNDWSPSGQAVVKKRFRRVEFMEALGGVSGDRLAEMKIPSLRARDPHYWNPGEIYGRLKAKDALQRLNDVMSGALAWQPTTRAMKIEYVVTEDAVDAEAN